MPKIKLTRTAIAALPRPQGARRTLYTDTELPGFALRLTATGGTYYANKRDTITGNMIQIPIGKLDQLTPEAARSEARRQLQNIIVSKQVRDSGIDCQALYDRFMKEYSSKLKRNDQDTYLLPAYFLPRFGRTAAAKVTRSEIIELLNHVAFDLELEPTAAHLKSRIRKLFNWSFDQQLIPISDVVTRLPKFTLGKGKRVLLKKEIRTVWESLNVIPNRLMGNVGKLLLLTGQRRIEVAFAAWDEVDLEEKMWVIPPERTKNGLTQTVPLSPLALEAFKEMQKLTGDREHVFWVKARGKRTDSGPVSLGHVSHLPRILRTHSATKEMMKPVNPFTVHNFRHTVATMIGRVTERSDIVKHVLNHKEPGATPLYDEHTYDGAKREGFTAWENYISSL